MNYCIGFRKKVICLIFDDEVFFIRNILIVIRGVLVYCLVFRIFY